MEKSGQQEKLYFIRFVDLEKCRFYEFEKCGPFNYRFIMEQEQLGLFQVLYFKEVTEESHR